MPSAQRQMCLVSYRHNAFSPQITLELLEAISLPYADTENLLEVRQPAYNLPYPILEEGSHALGNSRISDQFNRLALGDEALDLIGRHEDLVDSHSSPVSRLIAFTASPGPVKSEILRKGDVQVRRQVLSVVVDDLVVFFLRRMVGFLASFAQCANQPLAENPQERIGEIERINPYIE